MFRMISIGGVTLHFYNVMLCVGLIALTLRMEWELQNNSFSERKQTGIRLSVPLGVLAGAIGAWVGHNVLHGHDWALRQWQLGFTFYGMWLTVLPLCWCLAKVGGLTLLELCNVQTVGLVLAHACGRIGCFLGGCCFGCPVQWGGISYPSGSLPAQFYPMTKLCPIQLYEAGFLFLLALVLSKKVALKNRFFVYLTSYACVRFVLEIFRGDPRGILWGGLLSPAQIISFCLCALGLGCLTYRHLFNHSIQPLSE